jgi:hypothetical protein
MDRSPLSPARRRAVLALPAALALGVAGCAGVPAIPPPPGAEPLPTPVLRVGDRWRYQLVNLFNGGIDGEAVVQVTAVAPEIRLSVTLPGRDQPLEERYTDPWTVLADAGFDHRITFETPVPVVPPGAHTGQRLFTRARYRADVSADRLDWQQRLRVTGWQRVQVPAGGFDALRIERLITFRHPDVFRYDPNRQDVVWYAPAVGRWVLREWTGDYMSGGPTPRSGRTLEERTRWQLLAWEPAAR